MKKKVKQKKENSERWLLTYSDMITLLLALFILLYGMSNVDQAKYQALAESLNQSLGDGKGASIFDGSSGVLDNNGNAILENNKGTNNGSSSGTASTTPVPTKSAAKESLTSEKVMSDMKKGINNALKDLGVESAIGTSVGEMGLTITLKDDEFFDSGKAELKEGMKKSLSAVANLLNRINNKLIIDGYTDSVPISSFIYPSNWQLSAARAAAVAQYLQEEEGVESSRLTASGHGENDPIASNDTEEGRSRNRRIEITVLYDSVSGIEMKE
jgi:chemotaxis protein MotB